jgi:GTP-binding protein
MLNVYELPTLPHALYLLDLPGYGYAKAPKTERATFRPLIEATLRRPRVAGILWLLDIRRGLGSHDAEVRELLAAGGVRTLAVLTKGDKLPQAARRRQAELWRETLEFESAQMVVTSAQAGTGIDDLRHAIDTLLNEAAP